jgi:thiol-disulfide isomerase/thioredoxin
MTPSRRHLLLAFLAILISLLTSCRGHRGKDYVPVIFHVTIPGTLYPLNQPYIASSVNGWSPGSPVWKMKQDSPSLFTLNIELPEGQKVEYYYSLGDGYCLETRANTKEQPARTVIVKAGLAQNDTVARWSLASVNTGRWERNDVWIYQNQWFHERLGLTADHALDASNPLRRLKNVPELDSLLKKVQSEWRAISALQYQGILPELSANCYVGPGSLLDHSYATAGQEYILEYYQIPAFIQDYREMRSVPLIDRAWQLRASIVTLQFVADQFWLGATDTLHSDEIAVIQARHLKRSEQWRGLSTIFWDVSAQMDTLLSDSLSREGEFDRPGLLQSRAMLENMEPSLRITDALARDRVQEAVADFKRLRLYGKTGVGANTYLHSGGVLLNDLIRRKCCREASDVADSLFANVTLVSPLDDGTRTSFKKRYQDIDPIKGPARYEQALTRIELRGTFQFASQRDGRPLLSGKCKELMSGDTVDLASLRGKIVVLDFWTTSCGGCVSEFPEVRKLAKELRESKDAVFVSVLEDPFLKSVQEDRPLRRLVTARHVDFPVLLETPDCAFKIRFGIDFYPSHFVLNKKGEVDLGPKDAGNWGDVRKRIVALRTVK